MGSTSVQILTPAKLNLMLHLTGRRADGYHELQSLFQFISLYDQLSVQVNSSGVINLTSNLTQVRAADNLVMHAALLLRQHARKPNLGAEIHLDKRLPLGAGLGAGSSNAAGCLLALNKLWQLNFSLDELAALGVQLGADVPVFVRGTTAWAEGVGEILMPSTAPEDNYLVLFPGCGCDTAQLYQHADLKRSRPRIRAAQAMDYFGSNNFAPLVRRLYPAVDAAFIWLEQQGLEPYLTGSGSTVFCRVAHKEQGMEVMQQLPNNFGADAVQAWVVQGQNVSVTHTELFSS